ncbi:MAG: DUF2283 domain-containing protein [Candidatus Brocadiia bacterium]
MLKHPFLEVTYRKGKPFAGYLYLSEARPRTPCRTEEIRPGVLIDLDDDGEPLGIEFLSPGAVSPDDLRAIESRLSGTRLEPEDLRPILAS